ncbi:MAG: fibronectin type III domain-containing protein, partial [Deltaproteobacteria bacterium]|nr:fibronectin type III domain-containing protein [Deltaproteobacteria bacterium]
TGGYSAYSNEDSATTPLSVPSSLKAREVSAGRIDLSWSDNSAAESGYKIERKAGSSGVYSQVAVVGANSVAWSNAGLSASSTYYYRVRAYNSTGNSDYSNESSATTLAVSAGSSGGSSGGGCFVSSLL